MAEKKIRSGLLLDVDYTFIKGQLRVRLHMKGKKFYYLYSEHRPHFYLEAKEEEIPHLMKAVGLWQGQKISPTAIEPVEKTLEGKKRKVLAVFTQHPRQVPSMRAAYRNLRAFEYDIPFGRRYLMDAGLEPFTKLRYERQGRRLLKIISAKDATPKLTVMAFDIETYNPQGVPRNEIDPSIMISYACGTGAAPDVNRIIAWKKIHRDFADSAANEKEMLDKFSSVVGELDPDVIAGYNSTNFDLPYLGARAKVCKTKLVFGRDGSSFTIRRAGIRDIAKIKGRIYADLFPLARFLAFIGAVKIQKFTLENVYADLIGKEGWKHKVQRLQIWEMWDDAGKHGELADYSKMDAYGTYEIAQKLLPLEIEMSKVTGLPITDVVSATSSQLVEARLMHEAARLGHIVPNRPSDEEAKKRMREPIKGAYVKIPQPGIYENLVVFDFRGLYPSIITSHNIDPFMINCSCCTKEESYVSPTGARFCAKRQGLIPLVLEKIIKARAELKSAVKKLKPDTPEYAAMYARQQSLKILANSYYGYLAFARSRYYSREAAESVTAWGRQFITQMGDLAEKAGFKLLYQDTDSLFLQLGEKSREDALKFMKEVNATLPGDMELELEAFYPRGVFVSKKATGASAEGAGAKKKYALLGEDGRIKIRGFELVRRDWSAIAKETQKKVLESILKDGSKEKAVKIVKAVVEEIRSGKMPLEKFVIETQLKKDPGKYEVASPESSAALKANKRGGVNGQRLGSGALVSFIIGRQGQSVSEKAEVVEYAKDYDPNYYIDHQILPSVLRILKELGVDEDELKLKGKQQGLSGFF